jgi:hypothetical protein
MSMTATENRSCVVYVSPGASARAARSVVEDALDCVGWRWSLPLSRWLDVLVTLEEHSKGRAPACR